MNGGGRTFAGYRLDRLLATDTVSSIYRATPPPSRSRRGRAVALRVTHPLRVGGGPDADAIAAYLRRITAAVHVTHRALTPIVDAGHTDDRVYVATALIDGVTLGQHIRRRRHLPADEAVALLRDLAEGLDRAHAAGIVHGAISPRTILIRWADGRPKSAMLRGFGLETLLTRQARLDRDGIDIADVLYVAPEQLHGDAVDGRVDQYALACALYHCVAGLPPFVRETASAMFGAHLFSVAAQGPLGGDPVLRRALMAGLAKRAADRHASCAGLLAATRHVSAPARRRDHRRMRDGPARPVVARSDEDVPRSARPVVAWPDGGARRSARSTSRVRSGSGTPAGAPAGDAADVTSAQDAAAGASARDAAIGASGNTARLPAHHWDVRSRPRPATGRPSRGRHGRRRRRRSRAATRRPWIGRKAQRPVVTWPVATMVILVGIVATLTLASVAGQNGLGAGSVAGSRRDQAGGALAASGDSPASAGVRWQRAPTDEPVYALRLVDDTVVVAAPHSVMALDADSGTSVWRRTVDVGVLTDVAATGETVALRAATFRALSVDGGTRMWEKADIVAPISSLTALDGVIYGIGPGRLTPELVALDAATGEPVWFYDGGPRDIADDAAVVAATGIVALLDGDGLVVVDPDGATSRTGDGRVAVDGERWRADVVDPWIDSLAVLPDAVVVATRGGQVCAHDPADGAVRWCVPVRGLAEQSPAIVAEGDTIAVVLESTVIALALESGARRWTYDAPRALRPIVAGTDRSVVVSDVGGRAYGLDLHRGFEAWRASGFGEITALVGAADALYAGTRDGVVVRLQPPADDLSS